MLLMAIIKLSPWRKLSFVILVFENFQWVAVIIDDTLTKLVNDPRLAMDWGTKVNCMAMYFEAQTSSYSLC